MPCKKKTECSRVGLDLLAEAARLMEKFGDELVDSSSTRFLVRIPLLQ